MVGGGELFLSRTLRYRKRRARHQNGRSCKKVAPLSELPYIFKGSYDKANRTSIGSYRGRELRKGFGSCADSAGVGVPVLTDVHEIADVDRVAEAVDGSRFRRSCGRQTDLLLKAAHRPRRLTSRKASSLRLGIWNTPSRSAAPRPIQGFRHRARR